MSDRYQGFASSRVGTLLVNALGLPNPVELDRWSDGAELVSGSVLLGGTGRLSESLPSTLQRLGINAVGTDDGESKYKGLVFDASSITDLADLVQLQEFFTPVLRRLHRCARVLVIGTTPATVSGSARAAQRALEGFTRSLGKEIGRGSTVQLVYVAEGGEDGLASTLAFFLSPKSAYVSGQVVRIGPDGNAVDFDVHQPLAGKTALVTGASRGIGEEIARVLHRDGAKIIGVDIPAAAADLVRLMTELDGDYLALDITQGDAPARIAAHVTSEHQGVDIVVHNAGITRDRRLANMDADRWQSVVQVNAIAPELITQALLDAQAINTNGRIVLVSSIAGIAGNNGQTNYAASKAAVIGLVDAFAETLTDGITINAVAPGFILTQMTAAIPFATREVGQRINAMAQGGLPVDIAETIAWFASPGSGKVSGNVVRACGQLALGA